jgi:hypothetical protein
MRRQHTDWYIVAAQVAYGTPLADLSALRGGPAVIRLERFSRI